MQITNSTRRWGVITRAIHWVTAGILLWTLGLGIYMTNFVSDPLSQFALTQTHKSWGFVVFALAVLRVLWLAVAGKRPTLPGDTPAWQRKAAHASHILLYLMIFLMPLSGWVMSAAAPIQDLLNIENKVFNVLVLPDPWVPGVAWIETVAWWVHYISGITLALVLVAHVGAALKHHFKDRDDVLKRMTTG
ncbi:cytochrome b [Pontivivens insulae]|uniref:Cytochrome b561 n=1 Tax=Pontivivens insulae TaxID=1639689 RepID=A0A2R8ACA1_9RHOB|nr:cytochrome b [Pontivivens insulae]RED11138.1 cytochrome b561 [Pontivivens insulae]SPF29688.1 Cytochrome b561 [Pontivivens insulae]